MSDQLTSAQKRWRSKTPEQREALRVWRKKYYWANRDHIVSKLREWRAANPGSVAKRDRLYLYGVTHDTFGVMLGKQEGLCAICSEVLVSGRKTQVDHDHITGNTRGLLCPLCNRGLGQFHDNLELLKLAVAYLTFHNKVRFFF